MAEQDRFSNILKVLFISTVFLNSLLVFTPELGFDALWYHLTLPKLLVSNHQWYFGGGLLYYSVMPRLSELIFIPLIQIFGTSSPKLLQFLSGVGTSWLIYRISHMYSFTRLQKWIAICTFYITWIVCWQSGSAYIDLVRTLMETSALILLISKNKLLGGIVLGLAIGTKWLSLGSLAIYTFVFGPSIIPPALFVSAPWFIISYYFTHNPIYPIFDPIVKHANPNLPTIIHNLVLSPLKITFPVDDFISPIIGIVFILSVYCLIYKPKIKSIASIAVLGTLYSLCLNPPSSRFLLPYLPALAICGGYIIGEQKQKLQKVMTAVVILSAVFVLCLRLVATKKYIPFLLGRVSQNQFLLENSSKLPDTFVDSDDYVKDKLPPDSKYIIDNLHNLYYFPYGFSHTSWDKSFLQYDYLVTNTSPPNNIKTELLHKNQLNIGIYKIIK